MFLLILYGLLIQLDKEVKDLSKRVAEYVVIVNSEEGKATGTIIGKREVVTVGMFPERHVLEIITHRGRKIKGVVKGYDEFTGVVLIEPASELPVPPFLKRIKPNGFALVYGNSLGKLGPVGLGIVQEDKGFYRIIIPLNPGNNGSGVFDMEGRLMGIIGGQLSPFSVFQYSGLPEDIRVFTSGNVGILIPYSTLRNVVNRIKKKGSIKRAWLGISIFTRNGNVIIRDVIKGSPAEKAGLKKGDIVVTVGKKKVTSPEILASEIKNRAAGERVKISVLRNGRRKTFVVTLGESAAPPLRYRNLHIKGPESGNILPQGAPPDSRTKESERQP